MIIIKEYETKINLKPDEMFSGGISDSQFLIDKLRKRYEQKCEGNSFIVKIIGITQKSMITIDKSDLHGGGSISVVFNVEAIVYPAGTILVGCDVQSIERNGQILCKYDNAVIYIKGDRNLAISSGDKIIVEVLKTGYPKGEKLMAIAAKPFFIQRTFYMDVIRPPKALATDEIELLKQTLAEVDNIELKLAEHNKSSVKFFTDLFYPFSKSVSIPKEFKKHDLKTLVSKYIDSNDVFPSNVPIILSKNSTIPRNEMTIYSISPESLSQIKDKIQSPDFIDVKINTSTLVYTLVKYMREYIDYINLIIDASNIYNTETIRKNYQKMWQFYIRMKNT